MNDASTACPCSTKQSQPFLIFSVALLFLSVFLTGCAGPQISKNIPLQYEATGIAFLRDPGQAIQILDPACVSLLEARSKGLPSLNATTETQKRFTALEAARYRALAELLEKMDGLSVARTATVQDMVFAGEKISVTISGLIKDATVVTEKYDTGEEIAEVLMRVCLDAEKNIVPQRTTQIAPASIYQRKAEAETAARIHATASLREEIGRVFVTQIIRVKDLELESQQVQLEMEGLMEGVQFSDIRWLDETRCEVTAVLEVSQKQLKRLTKK